MPLGKSQSESQATCKTGVGYGLRVQPDPEGVVIGKEQIDEMSDQEVKSSERCM